MKKFSLVFLIITLLTGSALAQTADLFISEYIEGSSYNKSLEIFNGTDDAIDLSQYTLEFLFNGNTVGNSVALDAVSLGSGDVFVVSHTDADPAILAVTDQTTSNGSYNGDDVIILKKGTQVIDSMGTLGVDPGQAWTCDDGSTQNHTLRRQAAICNGDTDETDAYDICAEWDFFASNTFDGLGTHSTDCISVGTDQGQWDSLKAIYR